MLGKYSPLPFKHLFFMIGQSQIISVSCVEGNNPKERSLKQFDIFRD